MLSKLEFYDINGLPLKWFETYLKNRSHFVEMNYIKSKTAEINIGVPQYSILGPLLFIIYINDLKNCTVFFNFIIYAYDTTLFHPLSNCIVNDDFQIINSEMEQVYHWLCVNRLSLNINKTKFRIFHNKGKNLSSFNPEIKLKGQFIEQVDNFLGIIINENLSWNNHINNISIKISNSLDIMYKKKYFLPLNILKTLYSSMILPHLIYGILAWGKAASSLFMLQKKAVRIITSSI